MPDYDRLQAAGLFVIVWLALFFGFLSTPQIFPPPLNLYLALVSTIGMFVIALAYFWHTKTQKSKIALSELEVTGTQSELTIPLAELKSTGEVKELEVRFPNGERRKNRVCFYYVTVRAKGHKTVENVLASLDGNTLRIVPKTGKPSFGIDYDGMSVEQFDKGGPLAFVYALLGEQKKTKDRIEYVHPGLGQDLVLFFGVEGLTDFFIVALTYIWYNPRTGLCGLHRDDGTGTLKLKLRLDGQDAKGCSMMFKVTFRKWDSFTVTPIELPQQI